MEFEERERVYGKAEYYWGREPNAFAEGVLDAVADPSGKRLVDLGAGEGRDSVWFAAQGFDVTAVDVSPAGLEKAERLASEREVSISTVEADGNEYVPGESVDVFYSIGTLQYVRPDRRDEQFAAWKGRTTPGGVHAVWAFVDHPEIPTPPDWTANEHFYEPGELATRYDDWQVLDTDAIRFSDDSGGEPHEHAAESVVARNPSR